MRLFRGEVHYGRELPGRPFDWTALLTRAIIVGQRKFYAQLLGTERMGAMPYVATDDLAVQRLIAKELWSDDSPKMIARFGTGEMETILRHLDRGSPGNAIVKFFKMLGGRIGPFWWDNSIRSGIHWIAGVFPPENEIFDRFAELMLEDSRQLDLLAGWVPGERRLQREYFPSAMAFPIHSMLRPDAGESWTSGLRGRKVLVVSPFADSIQAQYSRRERIFPGTDMLPEFSLVCMKPVVSLAGNFVHCGHPDWFSALESMRQEMDTFDYDVALVSAGAYGLPLAAHAKRRGKKAVHMGGVLQMLFGIRGGRYDRRDYWSKFVNDAWVRPQASERPQAYKTVEGGSYW